MAAGNSGNDTLRIVLLVLAVIVLGPILLMLFAVPMMGLWGGMMGGYGGYGMSPVWTIAMPLLWLVILIGGGYLVYRWFANRGPIGPDPALEELRLAYARGDISESEFEERRAKLERD